MRPPTPAPGAPPGGASRPPVRGTLAVLALGQFLVVLNGSLVNVALPSIGSDLDLAGSGLSWVVTAYVLALGGLLLLAGRVSDVVGARVVLLASTGAFTAASLVASLAPSAGWLIGARAAQGAAAAAMAPAALALLTLLFPPGAERRRALGAWAAVASAGGAAGVLLGGVLTEAVGWRAVLMVNVPIGVLMLVAALRVVPTGLPRRHGARIGLLSGATLSLGIAALLLALTSGGDEGWAASETLGLFAAAAVLLAAFAAAQLRSADPLLPFGVFRSASLVSGNLAMALTGAALFPTMLVLSLYTQRVLGWSALETGLGLLPQALTTIVAATAASRVLRAVGPRTTLAAGLSLLAVATAWLATVPVDGSYTGHLLAPTVVFGLGLGLSFVAATSLSLDDATPGRSGLVGSLLNTSQQLGGAVGLAVLVALADARAGVGPTAAELTSGYRLAFLGAAVTAAVALVATSVLGAVSRRR